MGNSDGGWAGEEGGGGVGPLSPPPPHHCLRLRHLLQVSDPQPAGAGATKGKTEQCKLTEEEKLRRVPKNNRSLLYFLKA